MVVKGLTIHNKNEGTVEFTSLLFIPSTKTFDLFHLDRKRRVNFKLSEFSFLMILSYIEVEEILIDKIAIRLEIWFNSALLDSGDSCIFNVAPSLPVGSTLRIFCRHPRSVSSLRRN